MRSDLNPLEAIGVSAASEMWKKILEKLIHIHCSQRMKQAAVNRSNPLLYWQWLYKDLLTLFFCLVGWMWFRRSWPRRPLTSSARHHLKRPLSKLHVFCISCHIQLKTAREQKVEREEFQFVCDRHNSHCATRRDKKRRDKMSPTCKRFNLWGSGICPLHVNVFLVITEIHHLETMIVADGPAAHELKINELMTSHVDHGTSR